MENSVADIYSTIRLGIDFDNTIACYDRLIHKAALEQGYISEDCPVSKTQVRDRMRSAGREDGWILLQGLVYGKRMSEADCFPGVINFFLECKKYDIPVCIISHKTQYAKKGPQYDLREAALAWLRENGFFAQEGVGLSEDDVLFCNTREEKIGQIIQQDCTHFIDDLPEFLLEPGFPEQVKRILFDPNGDNRHKVDLAAVESWSIMHDDLKHLRFSPNKQSIFSAGPGQLSDLTPEVVDAIQSILDIDLNEDLSRHCLSIIPSGRNNRVYCLKHNGRKYLIKRYFYHDSDQRDRLGHEFAFTSFASSRGVSALPRPIGCDRHHFLGVYEYLEGSKINILEINRNIIDQACDFIIALNKGKKDQEAHTLPVASEACFSLADHIHTVDKRLERLCSIEDDNVLSQAAKDFVVNKMMPLWLGIKDGIVSRCDSLNIPIDEQIFTGEKCLSPSDFGFHNALLNKEGMVRFIDFEYAGWDDPAKLVCDFFSQPEVPVPISFLPQFLERIKEISSDPGKLIQRTKLLLPAYKIKWCCIMLNEFLPLGKSRRNFSAHGEFELCLTSQFNKVSDYFSNIDLNEEQV